jgi:hypothetical protein
MGQYAGARRKRGEHGDRGAGCGYGDPARWQARLSQTGSHARFIRQSAVLLTDQALLTFCSISSCGWVTTFTGAAGA